MGALHVTVEQSSWQVMQRDSDIADSGEPRIVLHCEKKHEYICSSASTSLKNSLLV